MALDEKVEKLELVVSFPKEKGINFCPGNEFPLRAVTMIGGDVTLKVGSKVLSTIIYCEEQKPDFTLEGYESRAKNHAGDIIARIVQATNNPAAKSYEEVFEEKLNQASSLLPPLKV